jgi:hypothetical protein
VYITTTISAAHAKRLMLNGPILDFIIRLGREGRANLEELLMKYNPRLEFSDYILKETPKYEERIFVLPEELDNCTFFIVSEESGGKNNCQIVCDIWGKPLRPFYRPSDPHKKGFQAIFSARKSIITIHADEKARRIVQNDLIPPHWIKELRIYGAAIKSRLVWTGKYGEILPPELERFSPADTTAIIKAECEECAHCHFCTNGK